MAGAAETFVAAVVGGFFVTRERDVTLTTVVAEVLRNDPERVGWLVSNTGSVETQVAFNVSVSAARSHRIPSGGGSFSANVREDFTMVAGSLHGRVEAGTTTLHITEIVRVAAPEAPGA